MGSGEVVSRVAISVVRRFTIVTGEPRHRAFPGAVRLSSGEILVTYREGSDHWKTSDAVAKVVRSGDGAETWSSPELLFSEPGWGCSAHHGPAQLSDGRLIVPVLLIAEIYLSAASQRRAKDSMSAKAYVLGSEDGGRSWTGPTQIGPMEGWFWQNTVWACARAAGWTRVHPRRRAEAGGGAVVQRVFCVARRRAHIPGPGDSRARAGR